jgi:hypothetical protein
MIEINIVPYVPPKKTLEQTEEEEKFFRSIRHYCFACKAVTTFIRCYSCGKRFCLNHAEEEQDSYEEGGRTYPICYHC